MKNKVDFFERCIQLGDFNSLIQFIFTDCKTEEELLNICRHSNNVTLDMITNLIESAVEYMNNSSSIIESAKKIRDSNMLSNETKYKLTEAIKEEIDHINTMCYKLQYFASLIRREIEKRN